ncbi:MAG: ATP synthase subunit I [Rhodoferax sp.]|nr:ATP synthase subunit I [Rhodoferax sp.]
MIDALSLLLVLLAGVALGLVFFGGLWWTVRRGLASPRPALWFIGSLIVRVALTLGGIYIVAGDQWPRLLAILLGFWLARALVLRLTMPTEPASGRVQEVRHAP